MVSTMSETSGRAREAGIGPAAKPTANRNPHSGAGRQIRAAFYFIYIALLMTAPTLVSSPARYLGVAADDALVVTWLVINGFTALFLLGTARAHPGSLLIALGFTAYLLVAPIWSVAPETSLAYGSTLAGVLCVAYLMSVDMTMQQVLKMMTRVIIVLSLIGLALYALRSGIAIYIDAANRPNVLGTSPFKGLFPHKIVAGFYAAIGIVSLLATSKRGFGRLFGIGILLFVILLSSSSTALVLLPFAVAVFLLTRRALNRGMRTRSWVASLIATAVIGGFFIWWTWTDVLGLLSRDATLTGRTLLWDWGLRTWAERPIFGWGYGAYFETPDAAAVAATIPEFRSWDVPHFHQTYIQTAVDFGLVGVVALVLVIVKVLVRSYSQGGATGSDVAAGTFAITLTSAAAGFVMYLIPSYAYTEVVPLFLFVALFASRALRRRQPESSGPEVAPPASAR